MKLNDILKGIECEVISGSTNITIDSLVYDSRKTTNNSLFIALVGFNSDGQLRSISVNKPYIVQLHSDTCQQSMVLHRTNPHQQQSAMVGAPHRILCLGILTTIYIW